jgi:ATP-dependent helicase HrpA
VTEFCEVAGLSVSRVREWIDVHQQIQRILHRIGGFRPGCKAASYEAIHKSLLSGLAGNIAQHEGNGLYRGVHEHDIAIFPGSSLYGRQPRWIMFHEIVETKRLYGRTAATIDPRWVEELFGDRCAYTWHDSRFDEESGTVRAREEVTLDGFTLVRNRRIDCAAKDRGRAHEVFVREALVEERAGDSWRFIAHNRALREKIDTAERKLRTRSLYAGDGVLEEFYSERLPDVCSIAELSRAITRKGNDSFLCASETDLLARSIPAAVEQFPDSLMVADTRLECGWKFAPGEEDDGVTIRVPEALYRDVPADLWAWMFPSLSRRRIEHLVNLVSNRMGEAPRNAGELVEEIHGALVAGARPFLKSLYEVASEKMGLAVEEVCYPAERFPEHLWPLVVVTGEKGMVRDSFRAGRESPLLPLPARAKRASRWAPWCEAFEHGRAARWEFGHLAEEALLKPPGQLVGFTVYPALAREQGSVAVRAFWSKAVSLAEHAASLRHLLESHCADELAWSMHSVKVPAELVGRCGEFTSKEELEQTVARLTIERVLSLPADLPRDAAGFRALVASAAEKIPLSAERAIGLIASVADAYGRCSRKLETMVKRHPQSPMYDSIAGELYDSFEGYISMLFDAAVSPQMLDGLPRYLLAFEGRIETAFLNPRRFRTVMADIDAFGETLRRLQARPGADIPSRREELERYAQWIEELAVAQFGRSKVKPLVSITPESLAARARELLGAE